MSFFRQRTRLAVLTIYVFLLFWASKIALGAWFPPTSEKGLWFYSGLAALLLGNLLITPLFTKPADSISYAVAAIIGLLAVNQSALVISSFVSFLWGFTLAYLGIITLSAILNIVFKDTSKQAYQTLSRFFYDICDSFGNPKFIFSSVFLFALIAFHSKDPQEFLTIGAAWAVTVGIRPLESLLDFIKKSLSLFFFFFSLQYLGEVVGNQVPGLVLIRHELDKSVSFGELLIVPGEDGMPHTALALDYLGIAGGHWLRAVRIKSQGSLQKDRFPRIQPNECFLSTNGCDDPVFLNRQKILGLVAPDTDISRLHFDIVRVDVNLQEGQLLSVPIRDQIVLYQIINGLTKEDIIQQKNTRGYVRGDAKKIGKWNDSTQQFEVVKWVPAPHALVSLVDSTQPKLTKESVGHFPGTAYEITADIGQLVTHNTAILGILGVGKTFLALELVERMIAKKIKVICLDLTNQYAEELGPHFDSSKHSNLLSELATAGERSNIKHEKNMEDGGTIKAFQNKLDAQLQDFLINQSTEYLRIYNPASLEVWRQTANPYKNLASQASLTPAEITRLFAEATLKVLQDKGMTDQARCCLVFEEAHSLIPEWTAVASEGDKTATNGTAKAILQGRKFGLGCLVITQRTANVTKSILNQCNTVFALRIFDATGMEFLKNYIGEDYAGVLSTLEDRHAVFFGRASSCKVPVLIRLNERKDFLNVFRESQNGNSSI